jgi:hypothetical protein
MEIEDIPLIALKPVPVTVACEIVTAAAPVLVRVKVWGLLEPAATFPKFRVVALAASVPEEELLEFELDFAAGVPAPVKPTQPESDRTVRDERIRANRPSGARRLEFVREWERHFVCAFMACPD